MIIVCDSPLQFKYCILYIEFINRKFQKGQPFTNNAVRLDGKVVIVTGCNTGIGKQTALEMAERGGRVYMASRSWQRCEDARLEIVRESGNKNVFNLKLDLSSQKSIREFVRL